MENINEPLMRLTTEARNPNTMEVDRLTTLEMVRCLNNENHGLADAVDAEAENIAKAVDLITERMRSGGRLFYIGAGTSGRLGLLDASECPPTFSLPSDRVIGLIAGGDGAVRNAVENAEDDPAAAVRQLEAYELQKNDIVCGIAASGRTPYVIGGLCYAREKGSGVICITNNKNSVMSQYCDIAIEVEVGPEPITGSTRMKSGTAQKLVLNILSTATMIQQGKTYGNLMVDLHATNQKLRMRSERILREIFPERSEEELLSALEEASGSVKLAAVLLFTQKDKGEAQKILEKSDGNLRQILDGGRC